MRLRYQETVGLMIRLLKNDDFHISSDSLRRMRRIAADYDFHSLPIYNMSKKCSLPVHRTDGTLYGGIEVRMTAGIIDIHPVFENGKMICFRPIAVITKDSPDSVLFHEAVHLLSIGDYVRKGNEVRQSSGIMRNVYQISVSGDLVQTDDRRRYLFNECCTDYVARFLYRELNGGGYVDTGSFSDAFDCASELCFEQISGKDGRPHFTPEEWEKEIIREYMDGGDAHILDQIEKIWNDYGRDARPVIK